MPVYIFRDYATITVELRTYHSVVLVIKEEIDRAFRNGDQERVRYLQRICDEIAHGDPGYTPYKPV